MPLKINTIGTNASEEGSTGRPLLATYRMYCRSSELCNIR